MARRSTAAFTPALTIVGILAVCAPALAQSQDVVDTFTTRCFRGEGNNRTEYECKIAVWQPAALDKTIKDQDTSLRKYVDDTVDGRLKKLDEKLVAATVASNLRATVVADLQSTLPNDPTFIVHVLRSLSTLPNDSAKLVQVLKVLVEQSKSDDLLREELKKALIELQAQKPINKQ